MGTGDRHDEIGIGYLRGRAVSGGDNPYAQKIATLERQLSDLRAALEGKWIRVDERLPEDGVEVLAYHASLAQLDEGFRGRFVAWLDYDSTPPQWIRDGEQIVGVTHWQPLPPAPKEA